MDWVLKASPSGDKQDFGGLNDISSFIGRNQSVDDFSVSVDSGFDILGDTAMNKWNDQKHSTMSPSKKPQGHTRLSSCVVDGCTTDLSSCRNYHRRHRVCETHSKTPVVTISGKEQRFCQQCSRFHSLGEFDEVKRSCRKRLDGHNKRRRKPRPPESMYLNYGRYFTNHRGTKLLRFGGSPAYATTFGSPLAWPNDENFQQHLQVIIQQTTSSANSCAHVYSGREIKFPFLLATDSYKFNQAYSQQVLNPNASADHLGKLSERLTQLVETKSALYLLSKQATHPSGSSPSNLVQPMGTTVQFKSPFSQHLDPHPPSRNIPVPNDEHLIGMFHFQREGLLEDGASQFLSFSWD